MIRTRLTEALNLRHPVLSAPMALASGGRLAAAVSRAGGLGLIGGGYGDPDWLEREFSEAGNDPVGCGFITWKLAERPELLDLALSRAPRAIFLSFGDPGPFAPRIHEAGALLICQTQTLDDARAALDAGARVIVAQGSEAGGHGQRRATFTLVPETADLIAARAPETLLCAAGGVGDGRGLAAALMLGADGVVVGSRFWASEEALVLPALQAAALRATGDDTVRSNLPDIARGYAWPERFDIRTLRNAFTDRWLPDPEALRAAPDAHARWREAMAGGEPDAGSVIVGEATGLFHDIRPAADLLEDMIREAEARLRGGADLVEAP